MKKIVVFLTVIFVVGCASNIPKVPSKRTLTEDQISTIKNIDVSVVKTINGVEATTTFQDSSAAGAQGGLIGALVVAIIDAAVNSGRSAKAEKVANVLAPYSTDDMLNKSLVNKVTEAVNKTPKLRNVSVVSAYENATTPPQDVLSISPTYTLAENGSALKVSASVEFLSSSEQYITPYTFEKGVPDQYKGRVLYQNQFIYETDRLATPPLTDEIKQKLVAMVNERYIAEYGQIPEKKQKGYKKYKKEISLANNNTLSKSEASLFLVGSWVENDGQMLKNAISDAHAFIAEQLVSDLVYVKIPVFEGEADQVISSENGRNIIRVGSGYSAGNIKSLPAKMDRDATWGFITIPSSNREEKRKTHWDKIKKWKKTQKKKK